MKLEIKVGIDFGKLASDIPKLIDGFLSSSKEEIVGVSKDYIKSGKVNPDIFDSTKARRKRRGNPESPPLYETGVLHNSIKSTDSGIEFKGYGIVHQTGDGVTKREFIVLSKAKDGIKNLISNMKESLRRKSPLVLKT
jgi:hypothetical protein